MIPPMPYGVKIKTSDDNDEFDETRLLKLIPTHFQTQAKFLLNQFNERGNELTWNNSGTIFINTIAVPQSNIFKLSELENF